MNVESRVREALYQLEDELTRYQRKVQRSKYASFDGGEVYLRVGPAFYGGNQPEMAVVIANVNVEPWAQRQGNFKRICKAAGEFAAARGFALVHENVHNEMLQSKHERDGFHRLPNYGSPIYILDALKVKALHPDV